MKISESFWIASSQLLITRISGNTDMQDVEKWEASLLSSLGEVNDNGVFKILIDLHGFKAVNFEVHKKFRIVIPKTLGRYGWRVGYLDMFPEAKLQLENRRRIQCVAAAHVHHDESKIAVYEAKYSRPNERFFTDPVQAEDWIRQYKI